LSRTLNQANGRYLTTGTIAGYCGVSKITVLRWIARGYLAAFRLPEGHYRIHTDDFEKFLVENDMPIPLDRAAKNG
jgi:excisionase family DNA binding protein